MLINIGINGFGRIGRMVARALYEQNIPDIKLVAINNPGDTAMFSHLLKYDSIHGTFPHSVESRGRSLYINGDPVLCSGSKDIEKITWDNVDIVYECSGAFNSADKASVHLEKGASKVLVSAPCGGAIPSIVYGVNHKKITANDRILSNASCTTNCIAPIADILNKAFVIEQGFMTTVHAYTMDQKLLDGSHHDLRRGRAAALSMVPTSTGAAQTIGFIIPELFGKIGGAAIRVPVPNVSLVDFTFCTNHTTSPADINKTIKDASENELKGILDCSALPLVSSDFMHNPHSAIFDETQTYVNDRNFCHILAWYDNEWGFACRMHDVARYWSSV